MHTQSDAALAPVSILEQSVDSLEFIVERLRLAYPRLRDGSWKEPLAEPEEVLLIAAEKVERLRLNLLRFSRQYRKAAQNT